MTIRQAAMLTMASPAHASLSVSDSHGCRVNPEFTQVNSSWIAPFIDFVQNLPAHDPTDPLAILAKRDSDIIPNRYVQSPTSRTCSSATYRFESEVKLSNSEAVYLAIPEDLRDRSVTTALLAHRQDRATSSNSSLSDGKWDDEPGLTSLQLHLKDAAHDVSWRSYQGGFAESGKWGAKFAEVRSAFDPEREGMESWRSHGHKGIRKDDVSHGALLIDAMRLVSVGADPVYISEVTVKMAPPKSDQVIEQIFTPGTHFEDSTTGEGQTMGGGEKFDDNFPSALSLGQFLGTKPSLPPGWKLNDSGELEIPAPAGFRVTAIEVAGGDLHNDGIANQDGGIGTPGFARLSAELRKENGETMPLMSNENVPKDGVMTGNPTDCAYAAVSGDKIILRSSSDITHVMGIRISLQKK